MVDNTYSKGLAYSKVKKAAVTDATKRALRFFGDYLGNCVYDREYIKRVIEYDDGMVSAAFFWTLGVRII